MYNLIKEQILFGIENNLLFLLNNNFISVYLIAPCKQQQFLLSLKLAYKQEGSAFGEYKGYLPIGRKYFIGFS